MCTTVERLPLDLIQFNPSGVLGTQVNLSINMIDDGDAVRIGDFVRGNLNRISVRLCLLSYGDREIDKIGYEILSDFELYASL